MFPDWAIDLFVDVGGANWREDLATGGILVVSLLVLVVLLITIYLAFDRRKP